jgi:hypothetical protein
MSPRHDARRTDYARVVSDPATLQYALWLFTILLVGRVAGQIVVAWWAPRWLPPMAQWQSGLLPYPALLAGQAAVLTVMIWISLDFSKGAGYWVAPHPRLGLAAVWWSYLYAGTMIARAIVRMTRPPDQRWTGGAIPIVFHLVVAAFQWTFGMYQITLR